MIDEKVAIDVYKKVNIIMEATEKTSKNNPFYTAIVAVAEKNNWSTLLTLLYFNEGRRKTDIITY